MQARFYHKIFKDINTLNDYYVLVFTWFGAFKYNQALNFYFIVQALIF